MKQNLRDKYTEYSRLQSSWKSEPTFKDLNGDLEMAQSSHDIVQTKLDGYKETIEGGKAIRARAGKSTVRPRLARTQLEWKIPALEEPFLNTKDMVKVKGRGPSDTAAARQNTILINYYFNTKVNKVKLVNDIARTVASEGTVIVKNGWHSQYEDIEVTKEKPIYASPEESIQLMNQMVMSGQMDEATAQAMLETGQPVQTGVEEYTEIENKLVENYPKYEVCDNNYIIVDPTCEGILANAQFIIHEYEIDLNRLTRQKYVKNEDGTSRGIYKNLDEIDFEKDNSEYDEYATEKEASFIFNDKARKKVKVFEYWGYWDIDGKGKTVPIVAAWIGNVMVRMEENPFAHKRLPFSIAAYMPVKNELHGEPDAELIKDNQETVGRLTRAFHDITTTQAIGQTLVNEQFFSSPSQWEAYKKGNDARFRADMDPKRAIHKMNVEQVSPSIFQGIDMAKSDTESLSATVPFGAGGAASSALNSSATSTRSALDATSKRELSILRRISTQLIEDMARMTVQNIQAYASDEEVIRITEEEFVTIRREDLQGEFDLEIDVSTPEKDSETAQQLTMLLQTNAATMDPALSAKILGKISRLWKLPDLAEEIENFEPTPDPAQEQLAQMQMQNAQLESQKLQMEIAKLAKDMEDTDSKIQERGSRAAENMTADIANKQAQKEERLERAAYYRRLADKVEAETDIIDQEYLALDGRDVRKEDVDDLIYKEESKKEIADSKQKKIETKQ